MKTGSCARNRQNCRLSTWLISLLLPGESPEQENTDTNQLMNKRGRKWKEGKVCAHRLTPVGSWPCSRCHTGCACSWTSWCSPSDPILDPSYQTHVPVNIHSHIVSVLPLNLIFNGINDRFFSACVPVLHQPVVLTVVSAVAHSQDAVIQVLAAALQLVIHT